MDKTGMLNTAFTEAEYQLVAGSAEADCMSLSEALREAVAFGCESVSCSGYADVIASLDDVGRSLERSARIANDMARSFAGGRALDRREVRALLAEAKAIADAAAFARLRAGSVVTVAEAAGDCVAVRLSCSASLTRRASVRLGAAERGAFVAAARAGGMSAARLLRAAAVAIAGDGRGGEADDLRARLCAGRKMLVADVADCSRLVDAVNRWRRNCDQVDAACDVVAKANAGNTSLAALLEQARADCACSAERVSAACEPLHGWMWARLFDGA